MSIQFFFGLFSHHFVANAHRSDLIVSSVKTEKCITKIKYYAVMTRLEPLIRQNCIDSFCTHHFPCYSQNHFSCLVLFLPNMEQNNFTWLVFCVLVCLQLLYCTHRNGKLQECTTDLTNDNNFKMNPISRSIKNWLKREYIQQC